MNDNAYFFNEVHSILMSAINTNINTLLFIDELNAQEVQSLQQDTASFLNYKTTFHDTLSSGKPAPNMAIIPAGRYEMGSDKEEYGHKKTEAPKHLVTIEKPFAIGQFPIMASEFELFREATEWRLRDELIWMKDSYPVINIQMNDIKLYLEWLSEQTGYTYRLPTEAEWEYAARAGTTTPFSFGGDITCKEVQFNPNFPYQESKNKKPWYIPRCFPSVKPSPVGLREANLWHLYDMHGNVWEFTADHWSSSHFSANYNGSPNTNSDPFWYVTKGGSWFDGAVHARSAARKKRYLNEIDTNLGFRVVREL